MGQASCFIKHIFGKQERERQSEKVVMASWSAAQAFKQAQDKEGALQVITQQPSTAGRVLDAATPLLDCLLYSKSLGKWHMI